MLFRSLSEHLAGIEQTVGGGWDRIRRDDPRPRHNGSDDPLRETAGESAEGPAFVSGGDADAPPSESTTETIEPPTEPDDERPPTVAEPTSPTSEEAADIESDTREEGQP